MVEAHREGRTWYLPCSFPFCRNSSSGNRCLDRNPGKLSILDLDFKKSIIAVMAGVVLAGIIMGLGSFGVFGAREPFSKEIHLNPQNAKAGCGDYD